MMAPINGATGKPAKTSTRRAASKTVVPVLPLNYPQRPVTKQRSAPPKSSPLAEAEPRQQAVEKPDEKTESNSSDSHVKNGPANEDTKKTPEPAPAAEPKAGTPLTAFIQMIPTPAESIATIAPSAAVSTGTPTVIAARPSHSVASPTPTRPPAPIMPTSNNSSLYGPVHEQPAPAPQPSLAFRPAFHQAHPSNGSMMFGVFQDSNASSPAPHSGSGFPPPDMMAYPPVAALDAYGRPLMVSPTLDGYPPAIINHHGPPTPHSFHGSQSSAPADDHSSLNHYPNGANGYSTDPTSQVSMPVPGISGHVNGSMHAASGSVSVLQNLREQDEALAFMRSGVDDSAFNDCVLELHFPDAARYRSHPDFPRLRSVVRMPAHRFILSRSRTLAGILKSQRIAPGGVVHLELRGEYMRPDVFCYALRTLYGWSLGDGILPTQLRLRDVRDDFNLALCYITVSRYLQLAWVHSFAVRRASQLLFWETLELAINFVLPPIVASPRTRSDPFNSIELLGHILGFIVKNFPKDFVLDANVNASDFSFVRLPAVLVSQNSGVPTIVNGSSGGVHSRQPSKTQGHLSRNQRLSTNPRLSQIKFGDISPPDRNVLGSTGSTEAAPRRAPSANETILSGVLLNLPYELLKQVLEDPNLAGAPGELDPYARHSIITEIIAEREARRLRTLDKSQTQLQVFQETLEKSAAPLVVEQMGDFLVNSMGFKEEVCPGDIPFLVHTWTQSSSSSGSVSI